jgi:hypothetical protein
MNNKVMFFIFLSVLASLNLGSIRKAEDPIRDTQTNPILYEQKKEEEKDGKKGPLLYHVQNYPRESFFIDPPFEKEKKSSSQEIVTEKTPSSADTAGWWEEQSTTPQTVPPAETVSGLLPEPLPEVEKVRDHEAAEQPAPETGTENVPSGKNSDYWW